MKKKPPEPGRVLVSRDEQLEMIEKYEERMVAPRIDGLAGRIQRLERRVAILDENLLAVAIVLLALALLAGVVAVL